MNLRTVIIVIAALGVGAAVGITGFIWLVGGTGEASAETTAPTLDINAVPTLNPTQAFSAATQVAVLSGEVASLQSTLEAMNAAQMALTSQAAAAAVPTEAPTTEVVTAPTSETTTADTATAERVLYRIDAARSLVSFALQEDLNGVRTDVVGTTEEVAGDIIIDFSAPASSQIGTIVINARTLETDNEMRNRTIRSRILQSSSDEYEFIQFTPTALTGLPDTISVGETYTFEIAGDLTILNQTQPVTFTAEVTVDSEASISGTAAASVLYADWGIVIPDVPSVANVTDDVTLTIDFVASQVEA